MNGKLTLLLAAVASVATIAGTALADASKPVHLWFGAVHADVSLTLKDGSARAFTWDRGQVTAKAADSLTIQRRDKQSVTFSVSSSTIVRNDGATYSYDQVQVGQRLSVFAQNGAALLIRRIRGDGAPTGGTPEPLKDGPFSKAVTGSIALLLKDGSSQTVEYDRAEITAISDSSLSLKRADGQTLTLSYDSSTVVREKGKTESVDDLKVGERAMFFSQNGKALLIRCVRAPKSNG